MSVKSRPWRAMYPRPFADEIVPEHPSAVHAFRERARREPGAAAVLYFGEVLDAGTLDRLSDQLAVALQERDVRPGDRVAAHLQNSPHYVVALLAVWKAGGIWVPLNPMLRERELAYQLNDSGASVLIALDALWEAVGRTAVAGTAVRRVVTVPVLDGQHRDDARVFAGERRRTVLDAEDYGELLAEGAGRTPRPFEPDPDDVAFLCYTSGTTGDPKGSVSTHRNVQAIAQNVRDVVEIGSGSVVLGVAPLFHITGLMVQLMPCLISSVPVVLFYRFQPGVVLDAIRETRPTFAVGAITAFVALLREEGVTTADFASFDRIHSGGAPISPTTARFFEERTGVQLLGAYGMTEATSATHLAPKGYPAPVDPGSGALSVGIPTPGTEVRILDDDGAEVPPGTAGEVVMRSPGVVRSYWNKPEATAVTIRDGWLYSGDVGVMDEAGWLYLVDRKKDLINCSGFKVWPREVEDALYEHPDVREVAVVGVADDYRGESVKAYVSLVTGSEVTPAGLITFAGERLAAYKRPREIDILPDLPKTSSGKILRRALKEPAPALPAAAPTAGS